MLLIFPNDLKSLQSKKRTLPSASCYSRVFPLGSHLFLLRHQHLQKHLNYRRTTIGNRQGEEKNLLLDTIKLLYQILDKVNLNQKEKLLGLIIEAQNYLQVHEDHKNLPKTRKMYLLLRTNSHQNKIKIIKINHHPHHHPYHHHPYHYHLKPKR